MPNYPLTPEAQAENALTLASALNIDQDLAAALLVAEIIITVNADDAPANKLADDVDALLRRTISSVRRASSGSDTALEIVIGACLPQTRGMHLQVNIESDRIVAGLAVPKAHNSADVPGLFLRLGACYVAAVALQGALGEYAFESSPDPFVLLFSQLGVDADQCARGIDIGHAYMAGAGAIGNGLLWAFEKLDIRGRLTIADDDKVGSGNLNRQILFDDSDVGHPKAVRLAERARRLVPHLALDPRTARLQSLEERGEGPWLRRLIVAVDSRRARRALQSEMPGEVFDASTTDVREIVVYHNRQPTTNACLSCVYARDTAELTREDHIAEHLGVPVSEVRQERISAAMASLIALRFPHLDASTLEGLAFDTLFKRLCAEAVLTTPEGKRVLAPFAFVSCLAGTLLAIEIVRRLSSAGPVSDNYLRLSPWHPPMSRRRVVQPRQADCEFCGHPVLRALSDQMWANPVVPTLPTDN